jgi:hypothetical protein
VSSGDQDDSFDWTHGWRGNAQFLILEQFSDAGDRGFEGDNNGSDNTATPYSNPTNASTSIILTDGYIGTDATNAMDPTTLGSWFDAGTFKGAVDSSNDWTSGWTQDL